MALQRTSRKLRSSVHCEAVSPLSLPVPLSASAQRCKAARDNFLGIEVPHSIPQRGTSKARRRSFPGSNNHAAQPSLFPLASPVTIPTPSPNATSALSSPLPAIQFNEGVPQRNLPPPFNYLFPSHRTNPRRSPRQPTPAITLPPPQPSVATKYVAKKSSSAKASPLTPTSRQQADARSGGKKNRRKFEVLARKRRNAGLRKKRPADLRALSMMSEEWCEEQLRKRLVPHGGNVVLRGPMGCWETVSPRMKVNFGNIILNHSNLHSRFHNVPSVVGMRWSDLQDEFDRVKYRWQKIGQKEKGSRVTLYHVAARLNPNIDLSLFALAHGQHRSNDHSHLCHNPRCVKPEHLVVEPSWVNQDRNTMRCKEGRDEVLKSGELLKRGCRCSHLPCCLLQTIVKQ